MRTVLSTLLAPHASPVFGAAKLVEHEVAALRALHLLGVIQTDADEYDLVETLRITRAKARALMYQVALRNPQSAESVDESLRLALISRQLVRDGQFFLLEVPDPLTMDRLRKRVRVNGDITDGSFSGSVAKLPERALIRLAEDLIPAHVRAEAIRKWSEAGVHDPSWQSAIKEFLLSISKKVVDEAGVSALQSLGHHLRPLFSDAFATLKPFVLQHVKV